MPKKPTKNVRKKFLDVRLFDEEKDLIRQAAQIEKMAVSVWVRIQLDKAARLVINREKKGVK